MLPLTFLRIFKFNKRSEKSLRFQCFEGFRNRHVKDKTYDGTRCSGKQRRVLRQDKTLSFLPIVDKRFF